MDRATYLRRWSELHGGADPSGTLVGGWLAMVHALATPLVRLRATPDAVTLLGLAVACTVPVLAGQGTWGIAAAAVVAAASGVLDSLDGAVAVMTGRATRFGAVLDAVADRVSDAAFVAALWVAGASPGLCVAAVALAWLHEYTRARAGAAGMSEVGTITVSERPTRVVVVVAFLLASLTAAGDQPWWFSLGAGTLVVTGAVGWAQLLVAVRRALGRQP